MTENKENINELLLKFYPPDQAEQMGKDIAQADKLFEKFLSPQFSQQAIDKIKLKISRRQNRVAFSGILVRTAAMAAIVIVGAVLMIQNTSPQKSANTSSVQNSYQAAMSQTDSSITSLEKEIELLRGELCAVRLGEDDGSNGKLAEQIGNVETEIIETENSFWKG